MLCRSVCKRRCRKLVWGMSCSILCGNISWSLGCQILARQRWFELMPMAAFGARHFWHCLERHGVEVDLSSGEASWQHGVTERLLGMCKQVLTKMAERGLSESVNELLYWSSFTHGQSYQSNGFAPLPLLLGRNPPRLPADPLADQPNLARFGRTEPGNDTGHENRNDEHCSHRVVQGDQFQAACTSSIGQSIQTSRVASWNTLLVLAKS